MFYNVTVATEGQINKICQKYVKQLTPFMEITCHYFSSAAFSITIMVSDNCKMEYQMYNGTDICFFSLAKGQSRYDIHYREQMPKDMVDILEAKGIEAIDKWKDGNDL